MFFCKLGKDRTGLISALVLSACGVSEDEIVADYVRSDGVHEVALGGIEKEGDLRGVDDSIFAAGRRYVAVVALWDLPCDVDRDYGLCGCATVGH
jgi:hypothetical protein